MVKPEIKKIKKKWIPILSTKEFGQFEIGETYTGDPQSCIGRSVQINLMILTNDPKKQSDNMIFKINEFKDNKLYTELMGYEILPAHLKRMTKRAKRKVEDSFVCATKEKINLRIKPLVLVKTRTYKSTLSLLRKLTKEFITDYAGKNTYSQLMQSIISNILQKELRSHIKKVYPVISCLVKKVQKI